MHYGHHLCPRMGVERGPDFIGCPDLSKGDFHPNSRAPMALDDVGQSLTEEAMDPYDHLVAGFHDVADGGLHRGHPGAWQRDRELVLGLKKMAEQDHRVVHDLEKIRIDIPQNGAIHGPKNTWMEVARTRSE